MRSSRPRPLGTRTTALAPEREREEAQRRERGRGTRGSIWPPRFPRAARFCTSPFRIHNHIFNIHVCALVLVSAPKYALSHSLHFAPSALLFSLPSLPLTRLLAQTLLPNSYNERSIASGNPRLPWPARNVTREEDDKGEKTEFRILEGRKERGWVQRHKSAFGITVAQREEVQAGGAAAGLSSRSIPNLASSINWLSSSSSTLREPLLQRRLREQIGNAIVETISVAQPSMYMTTCLLSTKRHVR
ncbi:hypothetical protein BJY52DRAFT_470929 [Lactarius psammicola]|nr:hypothetical protein BJY52DRAFT_470929 [Lactarius psammicola]